MKHPADHRPHRRTALVTGVVAATLLLAGCGGSGAGHSVTHGATGTTAPHNAADVAFATEMIPHHRQAVAMAQLVIDRGTTPAVQAVAQRIKAAQDPEITILGGFLTVFGQPVPMAGMDMSHGGHAATGMMSAEEMKQLEKASGKALEKSFLEMMVRHHQGAIDMSATEVRDGTYRPARELATAIRTAQTAEIGQLKALLAQLR